MKLTWLDPFGRFPESGAFAERVAALTRASRLSEAEAAKAVWCADVARWAADHDIQPAEPWHLWRGAIDFSRTVLAREGLAEEINP